MENEKKSVDKFVVKALKVTTITANVCFYFTLNCFWLKFDFIPD
jgi:hypothetical protein